MACRHAGPTAIFGYFPGKRLGWLEDTPKGVVRDWAYSWRRIEDTCRRGSLALETVDRSALVRLVQRSISADPGGGHDRR